MTVAAAAWSSGSLAQTADAAALLETLIGLEKESWQLLKDRNVAGMRSYMADDGLVIFGDGDRLDKAAFLKLMPDLRLDSITYNSPGEVRIWTPDVATLLYRVTYTSAIKDGRATTLKVMSSNTYVRRNGRWLSALYQETIVP